MNDLKDRHHTCALLIELSPIDTRAERLGKF